MKKTVLVIIGILLSLATYSQKSKKQVVSLKINSDWTMKQLDSAKIALAKKKIIFNYSGIEYYENGKLKSIEIEVNCKDGYKGGASTDELGEIKAFGFFRDYSKFAPTQFAVGVMKI